MLLLRTPITVTAIATLLAGAIVAVPSAASADDTFHATVSGHVTIAPGVQPIVSLYNSDYIDVSDLYVDENGNYTFDVPEAGYYAVSFYDNQVDDYQLTRFWPNTVTDDPSDPDVNYFPVTDGQTLIGVDGSLLPLDFAVQPLSITGKAKVGETLTANSGDWAEDPDFTYQWLRNGSPISHATDDTYDVTKSDAGKKITVVETVSTDGYNTATVSSAAVTVAGLPLTSKAPKINGAPIVGRTLTVVPGTWKPGGVSLRYSWYANGKLIKTTTKRSYMLPSALAGKKIVVKVLGTKAGYSNKIVASMATTKVKKR